MIPVRVYAEEEYPVFHVGTETRLIPNAEMSYDEWIEYQVVDNLYAAMQAKLASLTP